ncbi:MAG: NUDIX hydrolase [Pyrinomonadaceae bacterium]
MSESSTDRNIPTFEQVSAGGVVFRLSAPAAEIAIVRIVPDMRWQLPKGIIDAGETIEEAALREVREEAGIAAEVVSPIETIEYWFIAERGGQRRRFHKFVHFFLMSYKSGDVADHDHEVDEARWVTVETALEMLEFKGERDVVAKARNMIVALASTE